MLRRIACKSTCVSAEVMGVSLDNARNSRTLETKGWARQGSGAPGRKASHSSGGLPIGSHSYVVSKKRAAVDQAVSKGMASSFGLNCFHCMPFGKGASSPRIDTESMKQHASGDFINEYWVWRSDIPSTGSDSVVARVASVLDGVW